MTIPIILICIVLLLGLIYFAQSVVTEQTSTVSRASRDTSLTAGDDILSLEEDLRRLDSDPTEEMENDLGAIE